MNKKNSAKEVHFLELIPVRLTDWERNQTGLVTLLKPKFRHPFLVRYLLPRMKNPCYKVNLDEIGSYFWENCDGSRSIKDIADLQKERFGDKVEPLYDRIALFSHSLRKNRFITLKQLP